MTISEAKENLLATLESMDKEKFSLCDLQAYANILKTISEIQTKSYIECLGETFAGGFGMKAATVSELK